jgi:hypothetical protein
MRASTLRTSAAVPSAFTTGYSASRPIVRCLLSFETKWLRNVEAIFWMVSSTAGSCAMPAFSFDMCRTGAQRSARRAAVARCNARIIPCRAAALTFAPQSHPRRMEITEDDDAVDGPCGAAPPLRHY